mgnify:CR=1 FL=1
MYENCEKTETKTTNNLHVVYYEMPPHSKLSYGQKLISIESVAPLQPIRGFLYNDLRHYSNVVVRTPLNSLHTNVLENPFPKIQSKFRNMANDNVAIMTSIVISSIIIKKGFNRFGNRVGKMFWNKNKPKILVQTEHNVQKFKMKIQKLKNKFKDRFKDRFKRINKPFNY